MADDKSTLPPYLQNNSWEEELNFKLWVTKGARFRADKRCSLMSRWSQLAVTLLTSYIIILGIIPLLPKPLGKAIPPDLLAFGTTAISIVLLAYSLIEAARNYGLQAHRFHECALRISRLYNDLRQGKGAPDSDRLKELARISTEYEAVLESYDNHEPIDYATFQTQKAAYFNLNCAQRSIIWMRYYVQSLAIYHLLIVLPPLIFVLIYIRVTPVAPPAITSESSHQQAMP